MNWLLTLLVLVILTVVVSVLLFIPVFLGFFVLLAKIDKDENLVLPFWKNVWRSPREGVTAVARRTFPSDLTQAIVHRAQELNRNEAMRIRSLHRVEGIVNIYHAQFLRLSREAENIRLRLSPGKARWLSRIASEFFGTTLSDDYGEILDHVVNYSFAHGKNYATERPIFYITPRTVQAEEDLEGLLNHLSDDVEFVRNHDRESLRVALEDFAAANELQSMTFQRAPEPHMNAVTEIPDPERERLITSYLRFMDYASRRKDEDFCLWLCKAHAQFKREANVYSRNGRIGRRLAYVFFSMRLIVLEVARRPAYKDPEKYQNRVCSLEEEYTRVYPAMEAYLQDSRDNTRSDFLFSLQPFLKAVHSLSGNYRVVTRMERLARQFRLWREASPENMAKALDWMNLRQQFTESFCEATEKSNGEGPVYRLVKADAGRPDVDTSEERPAHSSSEDDGADDKEHDAIYANRLWNVARLLNAGAEDTARFIAAIAMGQPAGDYDRIVTIGKSGLVPGAIMSFAFDKRMSLCFLEPLDLFPLPFELETLAIVDDSLQTGYSASVAIENLRRMNFRAAESSVFVVLKYTAPKMEGESRDRLWEIMHEEIGNDMSNRASCIVDYGYSEHADYRQAHCILDRSAAVPEEMLNKTIDRLRSIAQHRETPVADVGSLLGRTCGSEEYFKPELLFSYPKRMMCVAQRWWDHVKGLRDDLSIVASGPLEVPFLAYMAMISRFSDREAETGSFRFLAYDPDRELLTGQMQGDEVQGTSAFVIRNFIRSRADIEEIKAQIQVKGILVKGCLCLFSKVPQEELEKLIEVPVVERYVEDDTLQEEQR